MAAHCPKKTAALLEYTSLTKRYCDLVNELHLIIGTIPTVEYNRQYGFAEEARLNAERARIEMELHAQPAQVLRASN